MNDKQIITLSIVTALIMVLCCLGAAIVTNNGNSDTSSNSDASDETTYIHFSNDTSSEILTAIDNEISNDSALRANALGASMMLSSNSNGEIIIAETETQHGPMNITPRNTDLQIFLAKHYYKDFEGMKFVDFMKERVFYKGPLVTDVTSVLVKEGFVMDGDKVLMDDGSYQDINTLSIADFASHAVGTIEHVEPPSWIVISGGKFRFNPISIIVI